MTTKLLPWLYISNSGGLASIKIVPTCFCSALIDQAPGISERAKDISLSDIFGICRIIYLFWYESNLSQLLWIKFCLTLQ
jgi:hypothetical protein